MGRALDVQTAAPLIPPHPTLPLLRTLAASCQAFLITGINALTAGLLSPLANASPRRLAIVSALLTSGGLLCTLFYVARQGKAANQPHRA